MNVVDIIRILRRRFIQWDHCFVNMYTDGTYYAGAWQDNPISHPETIMWCAKAKDLDVLAQKIQRGDK